MDHSLHSKPAQHAGFSSAAFDSPCACTSDNDRNRNFPSFRGAENGSKAIAGQRQPIVHTDHAFVPTARKLPITKTA
jgi:hypothetical protein